MQNDQEQIEALQDIRKMMQDSSKFLSLSGLSGVFIGIYALIGAYLGRQAINKFVFNDYENASATTYDKLITECATIGIIVLVLSLLTAFIFSKRKAKKDNTSFLGRSALRLLINMMVPLTAGGVFCISLLYHGHHMMGLIAPAMLIFYGLALVNSSKYTMPDIRYLGYLEICLGLAASFFIGYGLLFWTLGFGVLHILYGAFMWNKYERA